DRDLFHDPDLRHHHLGARPAAEGAAPGVSVRAERRLPRGLHGRWPNARQDGGRHQGRHRRFRIAARSRTRASPHARLADPRYSGGPWLPHRGAQQRSPRSARPLRPNTRRSRIRLIDRNDCHMVAIALALATVLGVGYVRFAPGTFGSAVGLLLWWALPASPAIQAGTIVGLFVLGSWSGSVAERHFGTTDPSQVVIDEVMGMLITLLL